MFKLRELEKNDLEIINSWRNNPDLISFLVAPFRYIAPEVDEEWYENYLANRNTCVRCAIVNENAELLGLISLLNIDNINRSASLGIMIGSEKNCGAGAGTFAIKEMLNHAFINLNLNRVDLTVLATNARAIHVYEKCGFVLEGTKRSCVYKNGKYIDLHMYSILKNEFIVE